MHRRIARTPRITLLPDVVEIYYVGVVQTWGSVMKYGYQAMTEPIQICL